MAYRLTQAMAQTLRQWTTATNILGNVGGRRRVALLELDGLKQALAQ